MIHRLTVGSDVMCRLHMTPYSRMCVCRWCGVVAGCLLLHVCVCMFTRSLVGILKAVASPNKAKEEASLERLGKEICEHILRGAVL